jgi:hypothetical protein
LLPIKFVVCLQFETVAPGDVYSGEFVLPKLKFDQAPGDVRAVVKWNGEIYAFGFKVRDFGNPAPIWPDPNFPIAQEAVPTEIPVTVFP